MGSPDRIPFVSSGKIDLVMGAMTWTAERAKVIDFTVPVHTEVMGVLTTEEDLEGLEGARRPRRDASSRSAARRRSSSSPRSCRRRRCCCSTTIPMPCARSAQGRGDGMVDVLDFLTEHTKKHKVMEDRRDAGRRLLLRDRRRQERAG